VHEQATATQSMIHGAVFSGSRRYGQIWQGKCHTPQESFVQERKRLAAETSCGQKGIRMWRKPCIYMQGFILCSHSKLGFKNVPNLIIMS
jgi:hypothetical protein